jgi:hypothetical protein
MVKKYILIVQFVCITLFTNAQVNCFVQTEMDRNSVYAQQPFRITITVLTATWYTAPLQFENLQIPNAFIMPFYRTVPGMFTVKGKQYAGLQFYYIVFPYKAGHYNLPAINIVAETPPVGGFKGEKINVITQPLSYIVKPIPKSFTGDDWFVAKDVSISETWNKPLAKLKVGDVIYRTISIDAKGTLPQFIPDLNTDSLTWAGVYPQQAVLTDKRDEYDANGNRTQVITYLLEKEGDFILPATHITWFNPTSVHIYNRYTSNIKIHVSANPNLGILKTLKDSLNAKASITVITHVKKGPYLIYGIIWYYFVLYCLGAICVCYFIINILLKFYNHLNNKHKAYLISEKYWFSRFTKSPTKLPELLKNLYAWWDRFPIPDKSASIQKDARFKNDSKIDQLLTIYYKQQYGDGSVNIKVSADFKRDIKKYRKKLKDLAQSKLNENIGINQTELK